MKTNPATCNSGASPCNGRCPGSVVMQAMYWGNKGTNLLAPSQNINQLPNEYLALGNALNDQVPNPFFGVITAGALSGRTISRRQSLLPYPAVLRRCRRAARVRPFRQLELQRRHTSGRTPLGAVPHVPARLHMVESNRRSEYTDRRVQSPPESVRCRLSTHRTSSSAAGCIELPVGKGRKMDLGGAGECGSRRLEPQRHRARAERPAGDHQHARRQHRPERQRSTIRPSAAGSTPASSAPPLRSPSATSARARPTSEPISRATSISWW